MFVFVDLQATFRTPFVGMFTTNFHTKFHMPGSNGLLGAAKLKAQKKKKSHGRQPPCCLFKILQKCL